MLVPIQVDTSMASPYNSLCIWVKHFFGYLFWQSWRGTLYIYLLSFPIFWTLFVNPREYRQIHTPTHHGTRGWGGGGRWNPSPEFFICCSILKQWLLSWPPPWILPRIRNQVEIARNGIFCALHEK